MICYLYMSKNGEPTNIFGNLTKAEKSLAVDIAMHTGTPVDNVSLTDSEGRPLLKPSSDAEAADRLIHGIVSGNNGSNK